MVNQSIERIQLVAILTWLIVRGKVTAGSFRMISIRIGCIKISDEEPWRGPRRES
jgi:hypothetical protein